MTPLEINKKIAEIKSLKGSKGVSVSIGDKGRPTNRVAYIWDMGDNIECYSRLYNWAESIADAWELFEEMPTGSFIKRMDKADERFHCCCFSDYRGDGSTFGSLLWKTGKAALGSIAICMAWLKWKGVEI